MLKRMTYAVGSVTKLAAFWCMLAAASITWPMSGLVLGALCAARLMRKRSQRLTILGSAKFAEPGDLKRAGMIGARSGLILGRPPGTKPLFFDRIAPTKRDDELVRITHVPHVAIFAPTGAGKGASIVVPALLTDPRNTVVTDFKGELARMTADHRRRKFGHRIAVLDPYRLVSQSPDTLNPVDAIPKDHELAIDDCRDLANAVVVRPADEKEPHWNDSAEAVIAAVAATVVAYGEPGTRSLQTVRDIISQPKRLDLAIRLMCESKCWGGSLASMGGQLLHFADKERASVLSSAMRHLRFLGTPAIAASTASSSFDPAELRRGAGGMTVYLVVPPDRAEAQAGLMRMWISSMLRACFQGGLK